MAIVVDEGILEAIIVEKTTIKDTAALTAKWTTILPEVVAFSNDSTAEAEASTETRVRKCSASTAESLAIWELNATVANEVSMPRTTSTNEALNSRLRKRIQHWHSMEFRLVIEIYFEYLIPLTPQPPLPHLHSRLLHLPHVWWTQELLTSCATIDATSSHTTDCHLRLQ